MRSFSTFRGAVPTLDTMWGIESWLLVANRSPTPSAPSRPRAGSDGPAETVPKHSASWKH
jgi:hypothetical protein